MSCSDLQSELIMLGRGPLKYPPAVNYHRADSLAAFSKSERATGAVLSPVPALANLFASGHIMQAPSAFASLIAIGGSVTRLSKHTKCMMTM